MTRTELNTYSSSINTDTIDININNNDDINNSSSNNNNNNNISSNTSRSNNAYSRSNTNTIDINKTPPTTATPASSFVIFCFDTHEKSPSGSFRCCCR